MRGRQYNNQNNEKISSPSRFHNRDKYINWVRTFLGECFLGRHKGLLSTLRGYGRNQHTVGRQAQATGEGWRIAGRTSGDTSI